MAPQKHSRYSPLTVAVMAIAIVTHSPSCFLGAMADPATSAAASLNPAWVMQLCQYGDTPGTWVQPPPKPGTLLYRYEEFPFGHATTPYSNTTQEFGSWWQTLDPKCQLRNLIRPYLQPNASRPLTPPEDSLKVMAISDSTDTHMLNYLVETLGRRAGGNTTEAYRRVFEGSRIRLHDRGMLVPVLNYAITTTGLTLFQMYIMGVDQRRPDWVQDRVTAARKQFDELMPGTPGAAGGASPKPQQPDIVVLQTNHWTLKILAEGHIAESDMEIAALPALPPDYIAGFVKNLTMLAKHVRGTRGGNMRRRRGGVEH